MPGNLPTQGAATHLLTELHRTAERDPAKAVFADGKGGVVFRVPDYPVVPAPVVKPGAEKGERGKNGDTGATGPAGAAATIEVGSVTTGAPGSPVEITNSGTSSAAVLNFAIPAGADGSDGADGLDGADGIDGDDGIPTALAAIGSTPNANGMTLSGSTLKLEPASASFGGVVTTGGQTIAGAKTLTGNLAVEKGTPVVRLTDTGNTSNVTQTRTTTTFKLVSDHSAYIADQALSLSGAGYASIAAQTIGTVYTIEFWYKTTSTTSQMPIAGPTAGQHILFWFSAATQISTRTNTGVEVDWLGVTYADGLWHHWALVCTGTTVSLYKDAALISTQTPASIASRAYSHLGSYGDLNHKCIGTIDQMCVWTNNLTGADILLRYNSGFGIQATAGATLMAEYRLNNNYTDSSGNARNLTAGGSGNSFVTGLVTAGTPAPTATEILGSADGTINGSLATVTLGDVDSVYGTQNVIEGLQTRINILGTQLMLCQSALVTITGALTASGAVTAGSLALAEGGNAVLGTTTGTKWGTSTSQKQAFWNATPVIQQTTASAAATHVGLGGAALTVTDTFDGYTIPKVVKILRTLGLLA